MKEEWEEISQNIGSGWIGSVNKSKGSLQKKQSLAESILDFSKSKGWLRQFQNLFIYGCEVKVLHKGKPKFMTLYLDNKRDNLLWVSSKSKAFLLDLRFTNVIYEQSNDLESIKKKLFYFTLRQFSDQVVLIFDDQQEKKKLFSQFNLYIDKLKQKDSKYCAYFSSITKKYALESTKKGNNLYTQSDILKFSKQIGLRNKEQNIGILNKVKQNHKQLDDSNISFECVNEYFEIQFCSKKLISIFEQFANKKLDKMIDNPRCVLDPIMKQEQFEKFLVEVQKQTNPKKLKSIMAGFKNPLSFFDFCIFLYDERYSLISQPPDTDQSHPLNHYFCYSSHNTYLSGNQLTSDSKVSRYSEDLQNGIKCVQLDVHDDGITPIITHAVKGQGFCKPILFEDVIKQIDRFSEQTRIEGHSHHPLILSLENHASQQNKQKMLNILTKYFSENLYMIEGDQIPTLAYLKGKIIVKSSSRQSQLRELMKRQRNDCYNNEVLKITLDNYLQSFVINTRTYKDEELESNYQQFLHKKQALDKRKYKFKSRMAKLEQLLLPISSMTKITSIFKAPEGIKTVNSSSFECTSLTNAKVIKTKKQQLIEYTKRSWLRTYPIGTEIGSDNYDPAPMFDVGAQIVALNTQTKDTDAWMTHGYFCSGRFCAPGIRGYVLKPQRLLPNYQGNSADPPLQKHKITLQLLECNGFDVKMKFRGLQVDMQANNKSHHHTDQFTITVKHIDQSFIIFHISDNYRDCVALRFLGEGYRVVQIKNKDNYLDTGGRIIVHVTKTVL